MTMRTKVVFAPDRLTRGLVSGFDPSSLGFILSLPSGVLAIGQASIEGNLPGAALPGRFRLWAWLP